MALRVAARFRRWQQSRLRRVAVQGAAGFGADITAGGKPMGRLYTFVGGYGLAHWRFDQAQGEMKAGRAMLTLA
jgi:hypothetical protein